MQLFGWDFRSIVMARDWMQKSRMARNQISSVFRSPPGASKLRRLVPLLTGIGLLLAQDELALDVLFLGENRNSYRGKQRDEKTHHCVRGLRAPHSSRSWLRSVAARPAGSKR